MAHDECERLGNLLFLLSFTTWFFFKILSQWNVEMSFKVHLTPKYFFTTIHLCTCLKRICLFFTIFAKSWHFVGFQYLQKTKHHLAHNRVKRGMGLFLIWCHKLFCMQVYKDLMACKSVHDVKSGIDPCPFWLGHEPNNAQFWSL